LRQKYPEAFSVTAEEVERWHDEAAGRCEAAGLWTEAVRHLEVLQRAARPQPADALLWGRRGRVWAQAEQWQLAAAAYTRAIDLDGEEWVYWYARGLAQGRQERWDLAGLDFARASELHDGWHPWYQGALALAHQGRWRDALDELSATVQRKPEKNASLLSMRGFLHAHFGEWEQAAADFTRAAELGEDRPWFHYLRALVCLRRDDTAGYRQACQALLKLEARSGDGVLGDPGVAAWAAWACVLSAEPPADADLVLALAVKAWEAYREDTLEPFCHTLLGAALCRAGRWDDAIQHLEAAPAGGSPWDWLLLARALYTVGNLRAARQGMRKAMHWLGWPTPRATEPPPPPPTLPWHQRQELKLLRRQVEPFFQKEDTP
jgi:tetratricopeptide (TPR) repeat protein